VPAGGQDGAARGSHARVLIAIAVLICVIVVVLAIFA
jgi:hypothetical protein